MDKLGPACFPSGWTWIWALWSLLDQDRDLRLNYYELGPGRGVHWMGRARLRRMQPNFKYIGSYLAQTQHWPQVPGPSPNCLKNVRLKPTLLANLAKLGQAFYHLFTLSIIYLGEMVTKLLGLLIYQKKKKKTTKITCSSETWPGYWLSIT